MSCAATKRRASSVDSTSPRVGAFDAQMVDGLSLIKRSLRFRATLNASAICSTPPGRTTRATCRAIAHEISVGHSLDLERAA